MFECIVNAPYIFFPIGGGYQRGDGVGHTNSKKQQHIECNVGKPGGREFRCAQVTDHDIVRHAHHHVAQLTEHDGVGEEKTRTNIGVVVGEKFQGGWCWVLGSGC